MNTIYVLVLIFYSGGIATQEFVTAETCEAARRMAISEHAKTLRSGGPLVAYCTKK